MRTRISRTVLCPLLGVALLGAAAVPALASGFGIREGSADWVANAFVGGSVKAYDASTAYSNPAGMALLDSSELDGSISYIAPYSKFSGVNTNPYTGGTVAGTTGDNGVTSAAHGGIFGVWAVSPDFRLGIGATAPFAQRVSEPYNFVGRYQSLVSSITDINVALALSYKVNDHLSIGGGPTIDYFSARLTQALNFGALNALGDPLVGVKGNDTAVGYNIGAIYKFDDQVRAGIDYRSRVKHDISGNQKVDVPALYSVFGGPIGRAVAANLAASNSPAKTSITLPDSVTGGIYWDVTPRWSVMTELQWTDWSLFNQLVVTPTNGAPSTTIEENWRNTIFAGIGTNYRLTEALTLQAGFSYDESPVTDSNRTPRVPDSDRYTIGIGAGYALNDAVKIELAYAHLFTPGGTINYTASNSVPLSGALVGNYDDADDSVSIGVSYKF